MAGAAGADVLDDLKVVDADTHISEPHDLWTSRVPARYRDYVPHVVRGDDGIDRWLFNDGQVLEPKVGAASVIRKDGTKEAFWDWNIQNGMPFDEVSPASYECAARLELMDDQGIWAQIVYPNLAGFGAHKLMAIEDRSISTLIVSVYNDAMAELQEESGGRLFPQALLPFWDLDAAVREVRRIAGMGLTGVAMCSEPHAGGLPDLPHRHWDPLWDAMCELDLPVNFHVGASEFGREAFFRGVWPSLPDRQRYIVGCSLIELHNAAVLGNLLSSDLLVRYPTLRFVSVESGIGWIPYILERLEYQLMEAADDGSIPFGQPSPSELLRRQVYACFWFEDAGPRLLLERIGFDNVMFESDFPHPTCMYPSAREHALAVLEPWGPEVQRKVMQDNAATLYKLPL